MAMLIISTQFMENYGAHSWDGQGECPSYWKCKGGSEFKLRGADALVGRELDEEDSFTQIFIDRLVDSVRDQVEWDDDYSRSYIVDVRIEADDYLSWYEKSQLEYEGSIRYPEPELEYKEAA